MKRATRYKLFTALFALYGNIAFAQRDTSSHEIPWQHINDTDIVWTKRVWREIAVYEKQNTALRDDPAAPPGNVFANVLLSGIKEGRYIAYANADENNAKEVKGGVPKDEWVDAEAVVTKDTSQLKSGLLHPLTKEEVNRIIACDPTNLSVNARKYINQYASNSLPSIEVVPASPESKKKKKKKEREDEISGYDTTAVASCVYPQQVDHYRIIEDWIFDKGQGVMVVRIRAIAPMVNGKPLFWVRYTDIRSYLAQYEVYTVKDYARYTWDEYFESRQFSSKITKVSNPYK